MKENLIILSLIFLVTFTATAQNMDVASDSTSLLPLKGVTQKISSDALRAHTGFLAHDLLEGRGTASRGEALAALYLSSNLKAYGLKPITEDTTFNYRIPVPLTAYHFDESKEYLRIHTADSTLTLTPPDFYHPGGAPSAFQNFSGELLFAGSTPKALEALKSYPDLSGYIVVMGPPWTGIGEVEAELIRRGVEGAIEIVPNAFYDRLRIVRGPTRFSLPSEVDDPDNQSKLPVVVTGPKGAETLGVLQKILSNQKMEMAEELEARAEVNFSITSENKTAYNVAALLPGSDPAESDSIVVFMAHYDHVGFGEPINGDSIWNGFIDNSSGMAVLLELARVFAADPPPYSLLFLFTAAEEQGLLGSTWFAHKPPISLERIKAVINIDGGAPPADVKGWTVAASDEYKLKEIATQALTNNGWEVSNKPIISDSDHWAFHKAGVPSLFLYPFGQADSEHIHTAKDEWRADFPFEGLVHYGEATLQISKALEN